MRGRGRSVAIYESLQGGWKVSRKGLARFVWLDAYLGQPVVRGYRGRSYLAICTLLLTRCTTNLHTAKYTRSSFRWPAQMYRPFACLAFLGVSDPRLFSERLRRPQKGHTIPRFTCSRLRYVSRINLVRLVSFFFFFQIYWFEISITKIHENIM